MADVLVMGGGICGLGAAMMLGRDGHDVRVLERDAEDVPGSVEAAWESWDRKGVGQFRQAHHLQPRARLVLDAELPEVRDGLAAAGAQRYDLLANMPPWITDNEPRPGDDRLWTYTGRRSMAEWVMADVATREPGVVIERGVKISGLLTGASVIDGVPHVVGATTDRGEFRADIVIDAMGRRSQANTWVPAAGGRAPYEEAEDVGFAYYTMFFSGQQPAQMGSLAMALGPVSILTLPGDNGTWSITAWCASGDQALKPLRHVESFKKVIALSPLQAHWLDGEALTDVLPMSGAVDRYRRFVLDGVPVTTGLLHVADAWACTNPAAGRGIAVGLGHAARMRDVIRDAADDPQRMALEFDEVTEREFTPYYMSQIRSDRVRFAEMDAMREGREPPPPPAGDFFAKETRFWAGAPFDADLFRAAFEIVSAISVADEVFDRPGLLEKADEVAAANTGGDPGPPAPTRADVLAALA